MEQQRQCKKCDFKLDPSVRKCPICNTPVITTGRIRVLGGVQLVLGLFLVGLMGTITLYVAPMMLGGKESGFSGTPGQAGIIMLLFGVIIILGITSIASGVFQLATGRRNKWIVLIAIVLGVLVIGMMWAARAALGA